MKLGVLGSGKVGAALGAWFAECGAEVAFAARSPASAARAAANAGRGARALSTSELVTESELILLALPFAEVLPTLSPHEVALDGKVVVDVTNPITPDHRDLTVGHHDSGAEQIARAFPRARLVKAFNATFAEIYAARTARIDDRTLAVFYAGDDASAKATVGELIRRLGFDAVDAGPLRNARYLEPLSLLNIHLGRVLGYGTRIGFAWAHAPGAS